MDDGNPGGPVLEESSLGPVGARLGTGAQAAVHEIGLRLPDVPGPLVYKRYRRPPASSIVLERIILARRRLPHALRDRLDRIAVWPLRVVTEGGLVRGVVLPRIPSDYADTITGLGTGDTRTSLREVQNLFVDEDLARRIGRPVPTPEQRIALCRDFADALRFLHDSLGYVFGDVNAKNEVFRLGPGPTVLFLDCDGVRAVGSIAGEQLDSPDWVAPESDGLTIATDLYKLGLFVLRCLSPGARGSTRTDPEWAAPRLDDVGMNLLRRALGTDPSARPSADEWWRHLSALLGEPVEPPALLHAELGRPSVPAGQAVTVEWRAKGALVVEASTRYRAERVDGRGGHGTVTLPVDETGYVLVRASNGHGVDERLLGPVAVVAAPWLDPPRAPMPVFAPPRVDTVPVPYPAVPPLAVMALPPAPAPSWPGLGSARGPYDLVSLLFDDAPVIDIVTDGGTR